MSDKLLNGKITKSQRTQAIVTVTCVVFYEVLAVKLKKICPQNKAKT